MRHAQALYEVRGKIGFLCQQGGWRFARQLPEITNQMGLVVVSAFDSSIRPISRAFFDRSKDVLKSPDAAKELRRQPDPILEPAFELTRTDPHSRSQISHVHDSSAEHNFIHSVRHQSVVWPERLQRAFHNDSLLKR